MKVLFTLLCLLLFALPAQADDIVLRVTEQRSGNHQYFHELLQRSLEDAGHTVTIWSIGVAPFTRALEMLKEGHTDIRWFHRSKADELPLEPIPVNITDNMIGKRVLVIPEGTSSLYPKENVLNNLRSSNLVGAFGKGWFDIQVWEANGLPFFEKNGDWRPLFTMIASRDRGVDYISRGVGEVLREVEGQPGLEIEPNLLFTYDSDFWFFLTPSARHLRPVIEDALRKAQQSGLMAELIQKYWGRDFEILNLKERVEVPLITPY